MAVKKQAKRTAPAATDKVGKTVVDTFRQALKNLGITATDVMGHHEYSPTSIVIVTKSGKKLLWGSAPPVEMNFSNR